MSEEMREEMEQNTETGTEDIYQVYMEELAVIPPCTEEENRELLKRVKAGDREAKKTSGGRKPEKGPVFYPGLSEPGSAHGGSDPGGQHGADGTGG